MKQVGKPKISTGINPRTTSSKDSIGLNIDYTRKHIIGYHFKGHSTIKKG